MPTLSALHIYPLKSCAPLMLDTAVVEPRGLAHDRRWMVVDAAGKMITGREEPRLTLLRAQPNSDGSLQLTAPGMPPLQLDPLRTDAARIDTAVFGVPVTPLVGPESAHDWLSAYLGRPLRLVAMDTDCHRAVEPKYAAPGDEVSLADEFPLLLISQAALDQLNEKLAAPVSMLRFRPNLVVAGTAPHAEDGWKRVRIGECEFDVVAHKIRCVFITVDFTRGERDPSGEPLRTLITYRRTPDGVAFGQNLIPRRLGTLRVGDVVEMLA